jgi:hypothetical protein
MSFTRSAVGALVIALGAGAGQFALAQDHAVRVFARGGGYNALTNLNEAGTSDFKKVGYSLGGGVGIQANRYVTFRGDFNFGRNELRNNAVATGIRTNRFFYDAAVQLQYPTSSGFEPYLFAGGGAVTIHQVGTTGQNKTRAAGTFGLGLNYVIPRTNFGIFAEGKSWLYKFDNMSGPLAGFDKTQFELAWTGGISYRFPW